MRSLFAYVLTLSLVLNPALTYAGSTRGQEPVRQSDNLRVATSKGELALRFNKAKYSLQTIDQVVRDLEYMSDEVAAKAFTVNVVRQIHTRFLDTVRLMAEIMTSTELSPEERANYLADITPLLGEAFQKILRYQREDTLDDPRQKDYLNVPEVRQLAAQIKASAPGSDERSDLKDEMILLLNDLETKGTPSRLQEGGFFTRFIRRMQRTGGRMTAEAMMDFKAIFSRRLSADMTKIWTMKDRAYRDTSSQDAIRSLIELTQSGLAKLDVEDKLLSKQVNYWSETLAIEIRLRSERLSAQGLMANTYIGMAVAGFLFPMVDIVGLFDGGWSENSLWVSSVLYLAIWGVIGGLKWASYSGRTVAMMKSLVQLLKTAKTEDPKQIAANQAEIEKMSRLSFFDRYVLKPGETEASVPTNKKGGLFSRLLRRKPEHASCELDMTDSKSHDNRADGTDDSESDD